MSFMDDEFDKQSKKMLKYGAIASIVSGLASLAFVIGVLYAIKVLFF